MVTQERAVRTRQALVHAAAELFAAHGYARASLPAISARAGVSTGALHFHFPDKDALAGEIERVAARTVRELAGRCGRSEGSALGALVTATRQLAVTLAADPVTSAGFRLGGDPARRHRAGLLDWWQAWVRETVGRAEAAGELADGVCSEGAVVAVVAATAGFETLGSRDRDWLSRERMDRFWTLLLPCLTSRPATKEPRP
ncbi:ScbR family autoregulator-binding transcription factor [Streptomyces sp. NPDC003688]